MGLLDGKVVVVTGAARGQGRAHAMRFAEEGADIIAMDICREVEGAADYPPATPDDLAETVAKVEAYGRRIIATETDVRDAAATEAAINAGAAELGRLDCLIANAGIASFVPAPDIGPEVWQDMISSNLTGVWNCARPAMKLMIEAGNGGAMCFISSAASYVGFANTAHYSAAKAGLVGLTRSLAMELGPHMIRVNTIHPCTVDTPMALNDATFELFSPGAGLKADSQEDREKVMDLFAANLALPIPWIEPVDMANAAIYLCSDLGRYVTGTEHRVDAGQAIK